MNTLELIKDAALFGGTVPTERAQEVREFLDNIEKQLNLAVVMPCLLCVDNDGAEDTLTTGREYQMLEITETLCFVINDNGDRDAYGKNSFIVVNKA